MLFVTNIKQFDDIDPDYQYYGSMRYMAEMKQRMDKRKEELITNIARLKAKQYQEEIYDTHQGNSN